MLGNFKLKDEKNEFEILVQSKSIEPRAGLSGWDAVHGLPQIAPCIFHIRQNPVRREGEAEVIFTRIFFASSFENRLRLSGRCFCIIEFKKFLILLARQALPTCRFGVHFGFFLSWLPFPHCKRYHSLNRGGDPTVKRIFMRRIRFIGFFSFDDSNYKRFYSFDLFILAFFSSLEFLRYGLQNISGTSLSRNSIEEARYLFG